MTNHPFFGFQTASRTQTGTEVPLLNRSPWCKPASMKRVLYTSVHRLRRLIVAAGIARFSGALKFCSIVRLTRSLALILIGLLSFATLAQEVSVPDPNFNAVIREALQKPNGPLTQSDMLGLTNLSAIFRNITNVQGLEAAQNLVSLDLQDNRITSVNILTNLTRLVLLDLGENRFPDFRLPPGLTNLTKLRLEFGLITNLSLPAGLTQLTTLSVGFNQLTRLTLPADMTNLNFLSAYQNHLTNLRLPPKLANLNWLDLASLTNYAWLDVNAGLMAHPVGQKLPNPWGLHGNVWEPE